MRKQEIVWHPQQVVSKILLISHPRVSTSSLCVARLGMYNTGRIHPCIFCTMKNHGLTCRIPPGVKKFQTDSSRVRMRPCLFLLSFCSVSSLFQTNYSGLTTASGQQPWSLETHYVRLKMRDNSCQSQHLMPLTCFHVAKKHAWKLCNWEDSPFLKLRALSSSEIVLLPSELFCTKTYLFYFFWSHSSMFNINNGTETRQP